MHYLRNSHLNEMELHFYLNLMKNYLNFYQHKLNWLRKLRIKGMKNFKYS